MDICNNISEMKHNVSQYVYIYVGCWQIHASQDLSDQGSKEAYPVGKPAAACARNAGNVACHPAIKKAQKFFAIELRPLRCLVVGS